jgi:methylated-DNA-protein-cysteine methyltransferase-like protein
MIIAMASLRAAHHPLIPPEPKPAAPPQGMAGFDQRVYAAVALIPPGQLATYGQIAEWIGAWGCARQVGWALRRLPLPAAIPWHRVVNACGRISMSPSREGSDWIQRELLLAEGIPVQPDGRLPLAQHRWRAEMAAACAAAAGPPWPTRPTETTHQDNAPAAPLPNGPLGRPSQQTTGAIEEGSRVPQGPAQASR